LLDYRGFGGIRVLLEHDQDVLYANGAGATNMRYRGVMVDLSVVSIDEALKTVINGEDNTYR
jgi:hypothetical protein